MSALDTQVAGSHYKDKDLTVAFHRIRCGLPVPESDVIELQRRLARSEKISNRVCFAVVASILSFAVFAIVNT